MAGVGRRGFAAVAQAAMFVQGGAGSPMTPYGFGPNRTPSPGFFMGGQRTGSPGVMMPPFAGGPPPGGVPGPYPPGAYGPGGGPPGPARLGSPNMPPYGAQRPGPGPGQYVGQDPRAANGNGEFFIVRVDFDFLLMASDRALPATFGRSDAFTKVTGSWAIGHTKHAPPNICGRSSFGGLAHSLEYEYDKPWTRVSKPKQSVCVAQQ